MTINQLIAKLLEFEKINPNAVVSIDNINIDRFQYYYMATFVDFEMLANDQVLKITVE